MHCTGSAITNEKSKCHTEMPWQPGHICIGIGLEREGPSRVLFTSHHVSAQWGVYY